jgi:anaerobic selenocysteine-containing dehydrogenase
MRTRCTPSGKRNDVLINPSDGAALGICDGDRVRVFSPVGEIELEAALSERLRVGLVVVDHGWGSRIFDPRGGNQPQSFGVNRNLLVGDGHRSVVANLGAQFDIRRSRALSTRVSRRTYGCWRYPRNACDNRTFGALLG